MNNVFLRKVLAAGFATALLAGTAPVFAKGTIKDAVVGAAAGHFVGHGDARAGAVVGCSGRTSSRRQESRQGQIGVGRGEKR